MSTIATTFLPLESRLRSRGYEYVAGIDEVGRGAWAGPLVAAAVILKPYARIPNLRESKQLTALQREAYAAIIRKSAVTFAYGSVSSEEIDTIGLGPANMLAFRRALEGLGTQPQYVLADYFSLKDFICPVQGVRGGDQRVRVVAAASVVAKVYRDKLMVEY